MSNLSLFGLGPSATPSAGANSAYGIGGLIFWLKADELTGYSDGDPVHEFPDSSINGHTFTSPGASNDPIYRPTGISSLPALRFQTNDVLSCVDTTILDGDGEFTVFVVVFPQGAGGDVVTKITEASNKGWRGGEVAGRYFELSTSPGNYIQLDNGAIASKAIMGFSKPSGVGAASIKMYKNGSITTGATSTAGTVTSFSSTVPVCIGGYLNPTTSPFDGYIGEVVAYSGQLSDGDAGTVMTALNSKWSIF